MLEFWRTQEFWRAYSLTSEDQREAEAAPASLGIQCQNTWKAKQRAFTMKSAVLNHH